MKKVVLNYLVIAVLAILAAFTSCGGGSGGGKGKGNIVMKAETDKMSFSMAGSDEVTIDWGDGTRETHEIGNDSRFSHEYLGTSVRTVTINGKNITSLSCDRNDISSLDVSGCATLEYLVLNQVLITSLDLSKNTALTSLYCSYSYQLTSLDLSKNPALTFLDCSDNQLTSLDLSKNPALTAVYCYSCELTAAALNAFFGTLHSNTVPPALSIGEETAKKLVIKGNPGAADCDRSITEKKGWNIVDY